MFIGMFVMYVCKILNQLFAITGDRRLGPRPLCMRVCVCMYVCFVCVLDIKAALKIPAGTSSSLHVCMYVFMYV